MAAFTGEFRSLAQELIYVCDMQLFPVFHICTRDISLRYFNMGVCISKQTTSILVFHLRPFPSAASNLKVSYCWNISFA